MSDSESCIFCDRKNFKERLISENQHFYFIASLGQITDGGYVILFPKKHISCMAALNFNQCFFNYYLNATCRAIMTEYNTPKVTIFEHGIVGQTVRHAHLHFIPAVLNLTKKVMTDFPDSEIDIFTSFRDLPTRYAKKLCPYLCWQDWDGMVKICWDPPAPPQYFRKITAELLNRYERANWREMNPKLDKKLCLATVNRLKKYFKSLN